MVTNPSSFVNSSRERSLSSTLSYPSLRSVTSICSPCPRYPGVEDGTNGMRALERTHISDGTHYLWPYSTILFGRLCWFSYPSSSRLTFFVVFPLVAFFTHTLSPGFLRSLSLVGLKGVLELPLYVPFCFVPCFATQ